MKKVTAKIDRSNYKTILSNGTHQVIADEPVPYGTDKGADPYSLLLMSLGSCVAITIRMYADRKKWDLEAVEVELSQERIHSKDCDDCESTPRRSATTGRSSAARRSTSTAACPRPPS